MTTAEWWFGLPMVLKISFLLVTLPAWMTIIYLVIAGEADSGRAIMAFAVFAVSGIPHIVLDRRRSHDGGGGSNLYNSDL